MGQVIATATYAIAGNAVDGTSTSIDFADTLGAPAVPILVSIGGFPNAVDTAGGSIMISGAPTTTFRRGDINDDGNSDIVDLVNGAQFLFGVGGLPVTCEDAIDTDDNGTLEPLIDTIFLAAFLFQGGPSLDAPYPNCGADPTPDSTDCAMYNGPCP